MKHPFYRDRREAVGVNTEAGRESAATRDAMSQGLTASRQEEDKGNVQTPKSSAPKPCELLIKSAVNRNVIKPDSVSECLCQINE